MAATDSPAPSPDGLPTRHLRIGWWSLLLFLSLGFALELMHGLKVDWYLNVANETRRLLWRLAHAHGALIGLVNVVFGLTLRASTESKRGWRKLASACLIGAGVLIPGGFLLGGLVIYAGDPGRGVLLVPVGAVLFFVAVFLTARSTRFD